MFPNLSGMAAQYVGGGRGHGFAWGAGTSMRKHSFICVSGGWVYLLRMSEAASASAATQANEAVWVVAQALRTPGLESPLDEMGGNINLINKNK